MKNIISNIITGMIKIFAVISIIITSLITIITIAIIFLIKSINIK